MIFVVGFAHSGTTFLCEVLAGAGFSFAGKLDHMEDVPLRRLLFDVDAQLLHGKPESCEDFHQPIRDAFKVAGDAQVVKQPSFIHCLAVVLDAGIRPEHVLLAHRDLVVVRHSLVSYGRYEKRRARTLKVEWMQNEWMRAKATLEDEGIPYSIVRFPRSVEDPDEIPTGLRAAGYPVDADLDGRLREAWAKWRDPRRVHFRRD